MEKLRNNIFYKFNLLEEKISRLESTIEQLKDQLDESISIQKSHMIKIKNHEFITDDVVFYSLPYTDLSPQKAFQTYHRKDFNFIFLDVSSEGHKANIHFEDVVKIPLEKIEEYCEEFLNKKTPIIVISEDGTRSIQACHKLVEKGFYNLSNVSGGFKFWPGAKYKDVTESKTA